MVSFKIYAGLPVNSTGGRSYTKGRIFVISAQTLVSWHNFKHNSLVYFSWDQAP